MKLIITQGEVEKAMRKSGILHATDLVSLAYNLGIINKEVLEKMNELEPFVEEIVKQRGIEAIIHEN